MKSVLVVDDEQSFLVAMSFALRNAGYKPTLAQSGEEALILINEKAPDLILLDLMMPGIGGLETLKLLKSHPQLKEIPVVLVSGAWPPSQEPQIWSGFLHKPFDYAQLLDLIKTLV